MNSLNRPYVAMAAMALMGGGLAAVPGVAIDSDPHDREPKRRTKARPRTHRPLPAVPLVRHGTEGARKLKGWGTRRG